MGKPFCPEGGRFMLEAVWRASEDRRSVFGFVTFDLLLQAHKPPSYFDVAPKLYDANPPPGSYDAKGTSLRYYSCPLRDCLAKRNPGSVEVKVVGELVYRYESATSSETKALIAKAGLHQSVNLTKSWLGC